MEAVFPRASAEEGLYESFFLRLVSPDEPVGAWLRYTVHKRPGAVPRGSVWCTVFDADRGAPFMHKHTTSEVEAPAGSWIRVGSGSYLGPGVAEGSCGPARWSLRFAARERELRHFSRAFLYRAPLPRTKLTSPAPAASFDGMVDLAGRTIAVRGWDGMVGHNWGSTHAERWIWLHGIGFAEDRSAWVDVVLARLRVAGRTTPWRAAGALSVGGRRRRLGGLLSRRLSVSEGVRGCSLLLPGADGLRAEARVDVPDGSTAAWRYADPDGGEHDVLNCSVASLRLIVGERVFHTPHGGAYELGMREHNHGVPLARFADG